MIRSLVLIVASVLGKRTGDGRRVKFKDFSYW
jgi:hypothetical protein